MPTLRTGRENEMEEQGYKLVIVIRSDVDLSRGKLAVQVAHAAVACALRAARSRPGLLRAWMDAGQRKVVLTVPGLKDLIALKKAADDLDILNDIISDAGLTEVPPGTTTCLGLGPEKENIINRLTGGLPLL